MTMDAMRMELRQAIRVFRTSPVFTASAVLTLGAGIAGTTAIFALVDALLLRPLPGVESPERVAVVQTAEGGGGFGVSAYMDFLDIRERARSFDALAAYKPRRVDAAAGGVPEPVNAAMVNAAYFDVVGIDPWRGRFFGTEEDEGAGEHPVVVLTHGLAERWFSGEEPIGRAIVLNGLAYTVVGITPPGFRGTELVEVPELFVPISMQGQLMPSSGYLLDRRGWGGVTVLGRLADGVTTAGADAEVRDIGAEIVATYPRMAGGRAYRVTGLREATIPGTERADIVRMSALLLGVVGMLWLVVCLNVANLFFARTLRRKDELAVRRALGAGRARVTTTLVLEFAGVILVAALVGLAGAGLLSSAVARVPIPVLLDLSLDWRTALFALALAGSSAVVCALLPAVVLSRAPKRRGGVPRGRNSGRRRWPSRLLIVGQVAVSVILVVATGVFVRTFTTLVTTDPGFDPDDLLVAEFDPSLQGRADDEIAAYFGRLREGVQALPGVRAATLAEVVPGSTSLGSDRWHIDGATDDPEERSSFALNVVAADYFTTVGLEVAAGRAFLPTDRPGDLPVLVVNEAGAEVIRTRTGRDPTGARLSLEGPGGPFFDVVGVVSDAHGGRARSAPPTIFAEHGQTLALGVGGRRMVLVARTEVPAASLAGELRRVAAEVDPNISAANLRTVEDFLADLLATDRLIVTVLSSSSVLALFLVAVGIYGLLAWVVARRTREFGVRVALGAGAASLRRIVVGEALLLAGAGLALGLLGTVWVSGLLERFLLTGPTENAAALIGGAVVVVAVTLVAAYLPARSATRTDPVVAMRME